MNARLYCADANPCAAAFRYHLTASLLFCGTPQPFSYMEPILNWAFTSPASACLRMVLMSAGREEEANRANSMAARRIPRKRLFWISNIATSDPTLLSRRGILPRKQEGRGVGVPRPSCTLSEWRLFHRLP